MSALMRVFIVAGLAGMGGAAAAETPPEVGDFVMPKEECELRKGNTILPLNGRLMPFVVQSIVGDEIDVGAGRAPRSAFVRTEDADAYYAEWIERRPRSVEAYQLRAMLRQHLRDYAGAIADLDAAIEITPNVSRLYCRRAELQLYDRDPKTRKVRSQERLTADCDAAIRLNSNEVMAYCIRLELQAELKPGFNGKAMEEYARMTMVAPQDAESCEARGQQLQTLQLPVQAVRDFDKAIDMEPYCARLYILRAGSRPWPKEQAATFRDLDTAIRLAPKSAIAYGERGRHLMNANRPKEALADMRKAVELEPTYFRVVANYATSLCIYPDPAFRDGKEAMKLAQEAYRLGPEAWETRKAMGMAYAETGDLVKAEEYLLSALEHTHDMSKDAAAKIAYYVNRVRAGVHPAHN